MRTKSATNLISRVDQNRPGGNSNLIKAVKLTHRVLTIDLIYIAWINWLNKQVGTFDQGQWSHSGYWTNRGVQIRLSEWKLLMYNDHWWVQSVMAVSQFYSVSKSGDEVSNRMEGGPPGVTRHYLVRASFWRDAHWSCSISRALLSSIDEIFKTNHKASSSSFLGFSV